jgi:hypothetical protein
MYIENIIYKYVWYINVKHICLLFFKIKKHGIYMFLMCMFVVLKKSVYKKYFNPNCKSVY